MNNNYFGLRENIRYLSIILSFLVAFILNSNKLHGFAFSWLIIIIVLGNVRRISNDNGFKYFIRMTLYFISYGIPSILLLGNSHKNYDKVLIWAIVGLIVGITANLIKRKQIKVYLSETYVALSKKQDKSQYILMIYNLIGAAICEELYFRRFMIMTFYEYKYIAILFSTIYFLLSHYILIWGSDFQKNDFITQFFIGLISGIIYIFSDSVIPCIILHLMMNFPNIILQFKCYSRHYFKKEYYDKLLEENCEDDLPI